MLPELTFEEKVNYIKNHFEEIFKTESYFLRESKRNIVIFIERFTEKTTLQKLGEKNNLSRARIRQIIERVKRRVEQSKLFSLGHKAPEKAALLSSSPIEKLGLSLRSENCLRAEGIRTIGELLLFSENALLKTPNLGKRSLKEIKDTLVKHGLHLLGG